METVFILYLIIGLLFDVSLRTAVCILLSFCKSAVIVILSFLLQKELEIDPDPDMTDYFFWIISVYFWSYSLTRISSSNMTTAKQISKKWRLFRRLHRLDAGTTVPPVTTLVSHEELKKAIALVYSQDEPILVTLLWGVLHGPSGIPWGRKSKLIYIEIYQYKSN